MCEVLVTFDVDPLRNEEVNIKIDSEWAVREGVVCEPFINTRTIKQNGVTQWGLRRHRGFPARDILVSAWVPHKHATYEQRFFVRGAETDVSIFVNKNNNYCRTFGGVFESDRARPFPSRISVSDQGQINLDDRTYFVPSKLISPVADIVRHDGTWLMCSSREGKTYIADPQHIHEFDFPAKNIKITPQLINVQVDSSRSA
ncbi:MAG: hypothetical protein GWO20_14630, partial [Candidatus Korarchaeota archaeon]|nr:hypothetical protein [Candidatus Korarchaeota archaeon]